ncbi:hypothetical protein ILYODFUR_029886 [Ilyodon furcidens]|uniref:Uncharacterized protein n=2 Tax=Goodeidae TaxID=28758 RepID=A0ABV0V7X9_9TELE
MGSIQVSAGQPKWLGPEKGNDGGFKSCSSQAHHGCSPDPLHVWLPITALLLLPLLPLGLYMVVLPITATEKEKEKRGSRIQKRIRRGERRSKKKHRESTGMSVVFSGQG